MILKHSSRFKSLLAVLKPDQITLWLLGKQWCSDWLLLLFISHSIFFLNFWDSVVWKDHVAASFWYLVCNQRRFFEFFNVILCYFCLSFFFFLFHRKCYWKKRESVFCILNVCVNDWVSEWVEWDVFSSGQQEGVAILLL